MASPTILPQEGRGSFRDRSTGDVEADWALDRSALWNAAERAERRRDSRVAREFEIALPHELSADARLSLARTFAQDLADRYGAAVDFAIHVPQGKSDIRNVHAHVMMTTREVIPDGLGEKTMIERENRWLLANGLPTSHMQMRDIRKAFADHVNRHLLEAGLDIRVDHRSHLDRGLELSPTEHMGVHASQMERRGLDVSRARLEDKAAKKNADLIAEKTGRGFAHSDRREKASSIAMTSPAPSIATLTTMTDSSAPLQP